MKMITRCPRCGTAFRVQPEQLAVREGHVRCGQCASVFDARETLVAEPEPPLATDLQSAGLAPAPAAGADAVERAPGTHEAAIADAADQASVPPPPLNGPGGSEIGEVAGVALSPPDAGPELPDAGPQLPDAGPELPDAGPQLPDAGPQLLDAGPQLSDAGPLMADAGSSPPQAEPAPLATTAESPPPGATAESPEYEFGPAPRRRARMRDAAWLGASVAAFVLLGAQLLYAYRTELAYHGFAAAQPWPEALCRLLGCTIPLPQHAELISIESSELHPERGMDGVLTLAAVLRNRAPYPQPLPQLELTLTDGRDRPVARRVLRPGEYLPDPPAAEGVFPANSEFALRLHLDATNLQAGGYRLYAFYR